MAAEQRTGGGFSDAGMGLACDCAPRSGQSAGDVRMSDLGQRAKYLVLV
jgi:hypothetical protein